MTEQIADAVTLVRKAIYAATSPLVGAYLGLPKSYWLLGEQGAPLPYLVVQSQDQGGRDASMLGLAGWRGQFTVKALADTQSGAEDALAGVPAAMANLSSTGFTITATLVRPLVLPPKDGVWQAGLIYDIELYRS